MSDDEEKPGRDFVQFGPALPNGTHASIRHKPDGTVEVGAAKLVQEGENMAGSHIVFANKADDGVFDVVGELDLRGSSASGPGPAKVTTEAYRDGWDRVFGARTVGSA